MKDIYKKEKKRNRIYTQYRINNIVIITPNTVSRFDIYLQEKCLVILYHDAFYIPIMNIGCYFKL